jgi:hypothetical protein
MNFKVRLYLIQVARQKDKFAYYSDIVKDCGLEGDINLKTEYGRAAFTKLLSEVSEFEDKNERPLLSSVAIYKDANRNDHGDGFYIVAEKLKKGKFKKLKDDLYGFSEAAECRKFWQNEDNYRNFANTEIIASQSHPVAKLFESLFRAEEYQWAKEDWWDYYVDFVVDVKKLQTALADNPKLNIDNAKLYIALSEPIRSYESFMQKWLKEHRNGISSRGQSVLSGVNFKTIIEDSDFKAIAKLVISDPSPTTYKLLTNWWYNNEEISNRPLLINRALAACLPERLSSTVDNAKFWYVVNILKTKYGFQTSPDAEGNWFVANEQLTHWLDTHLEHELNKISTDKLEQEIWRNIVVWLVYDKFHGKQLIAANELVRRDVPQDGYDQMPPSKTTFEGRDVDFEKQAKEQKELGDAGEELVKQHEIVQLQKRGMHDKITEVRIAETGEGFDVYSFDENGREKFIEVKTTTGSWKNRFYLTRHELKFMRERESNFSLYRVYNFDEENNSGEFFELTGDVEDQLIKEPTVFEVVVKRQNLDR